LLAIAAAAPLDAVVRVIPATSYASSKALVRALQARDDARILFGARTNCYDHGRQTELAVVLFHGLTNNPIQCARLAGALYARGCNVLVPRLPGHGDVDRLSTRLENVTAEELTFFALEAVRAARGLGRRLAVSGISLGGALCAWLATCDADIDRCVCIAPALALNHVSYALDRVIVRAMVALPPTVYAWWDPKLKMKITPKHAYPRYPVRVLGECYRIGEAVIDAKGPFPGRGRTRVLFVVNPLDGTVNYELTQSLAQRWHDLHFVDADFVALGGLPPVHDVIEPDSPSQRIDVVYPKIIELIVARDEPHMKHNGYIT
jgi:carboxylesterase